MVKVGARLKSQVCATQVVVVRCPAEDPELACGGHPMIPITEEPTSGLQLDPAQASGAQLGKRVILPERGDLELLVTQAGDGTLAAAGVPLVVKEAKALPASD